MGSSSESVRYGVIGLGYFAQAAILPAFHRLKSSKLVALFSDDPEKLETLGDQYKVQHRLGYEQLDQFLSEGQLDAVYIALPNALHAEYAIRAARHGVHVLCEKPMAITEEDCLRMIAAASEAHIKLMIGYRLHFEAANLNAVDLIHSLHSIGEPRIFNSVFSMQIAPGNSRLNPTSAGGGPLYDIGIYCINAARYLFRDEPLEVSAFTGTQEGDERFGGTEEQISAMLRFSDGRLATFIASFGAADTSRYQVVGTGGVVELDAAYEYEQEMKLELRSGKRHVKRVFKRSDQIASELIYFSRCILEDLEPEPSGTEGLADVRIIRALISSADTGKAVRLEPILRSSRPDHAQEIHVRPHGMPDLVHVAAPSQ